MVTLIHHRWECIVVQVLWVFFSDLDIDLPNDPAVLFLGVYSKELKTETQIAPCRPTFIAALFTVAKRWKQLKCPSTGEWINKMCHVHTSQYFLVIKRNEVLIHVQCCGD